MGFNSGFKGLMNEMTVVQSQAWYGLLICCNRQASNYNYKRIWTKLFKQNLHETSARVLHSATSCRVVWQQHVSHHTNTFKGKERERERERERLILTSNFSELTKQAKTGTHSVSASSAVMFLSLFFFFFTYMHPNQNRKQLLPAQKSSAT